MPGVMFKYLIGYSYGIGPDVGDGELEVEAENILEAITAADEELNGPQNDDFLGEMWITSVEQLN